MGKLWAGVMENRQATLNLKLLGPPVIQLGQSSEELKLPRARVRALLFYLATESRVHSREELAQLIWPDTARQRRDLSEALSDIRKHIGDQCIESNYEQILLQAPDTDLSHLLELAATKEDDYQALLKLTAGIKIYRGEFLEGFWIRDANEFSSWVEEKRQYYTGIAINIFHKLASLHLKAESFDEAASISLKAIVLDPYREDFYRIAMTAFYNANKRHKAIQLYSRLNETLENDLEIKPSPETTQLNEKIRSSTLEKSVSHLERRKSNLPNLPPLIGRTTELETVSSLLDQPDTRLITICGIGGVGKTHLAIYASSRAGSFSNGICFVEMTGMQESSLLISEIAKALGVRTDSEAPLLETLKSYLDNKEVLIVLDNCEPKTFDVKFIENLIGDTEKAKFLVTSAEPLHITSEVVFQLKPLELLQPNENPSIEAIEKNSAVAMLLARMGTHTPEFQLTAENAPAILRICELLEGLPLAIELAASLLRKVSPQNFIAELENNGVLSVLETTADALPPRQQAVRETIRLSVNRLSTSAQDIFFRLCVFVGGFTVEAAYHACIDIVENELELSWVLDEITELNLIQRTYSNDIIPHFSLLDILRKFGLENLSTRSGLLDTVQEKHANYFLSLVQKAEPKQFQSHQEKWLDVIEVEVSNIRASLDWFLASQKLSQGLALAGSLWPFWFLRGFMVEGSQYFKKFLDLEAQENQAVPPETKAKALLGYGVLCLYQSQFDTAQNAFKASQALYEKMGDKLNIARSLSNLGDVARYRGDYKIATLYYQGCLEIQRQVEDKPGIAYSLNRLGVLARDQGDAKHAYGLHEQSLGIEQELNNARGVGYSMFNLGVASFFLSKLNNSELHLKAAYEILEQSLLIRRRIQDKPGMAASLGWLGVTEIELNRFAKALQSFWEGLDIHDQLGTKGGITLILDGLALLHHKRNQPEEAVYFSAAAKSLRENLGAPMAQSWQAEVEKWLLPTISKLGEAGALAWDRGREEDFDAIILRLKEVIDELLTQYAQFPEKAS